ncbi:MAG TPA: diguanylate cyclase [Solirubrobacteraceae bacterium]|jgi:GGDEF domain-containing protein|nr:diguanylate cyclase [Solirubrobacteraceae bacterium]
MAASEIDSERPHRGSIEHLSEHALRERMEEEVNRAGRHGTALSCLLLSLDDLPELRRAGGEELCEQVLAYVQLALRHELRRFDRVGRGPHGELLLLLPGADLTRGEIVARRVLARLRAIKLVLAGERRALRVAAGLAPWRAGMSAGALLDRTRAAAITENGRPPS